MTEQQDSDIVLFVHHLKKYFPIQTGLRRSKGFVKAVDDVSFTLRRGETLGIVGETGCGKTTLGRTILRLIDPTEGEVYFNLPKEVMDEVIQKETRRDKLSSIENPTDPEKQELKELTSELEKLREEHSLSSASRSKILKYRQQMQPVFQDPFSSLDPRMLVKDIIAEPMKLLTKANGEEIFKKSKEIVEEMGLSEDHLYRFPHEFSGGQRQRIGLARSIVIEPTLLVLDEPTSALDVSVQAQILNMLTETQRKRGLSFLFISHHLSVIRMVSDKVAVMYLGRIVELTNTNTLFTDMLHPYTKSLLSAIPVPDPETKRQKIILPGEIPNPANPPKGCHFHPRCPVAMKTCGWSPEDLAEPLRSTLDPYRNPEASKMPEISEIVVKEDDGILDLILQAPVQDRQMVTDLLWGLIKKEAAQKEGVKFEAIKSIEFLGDNNSIRITMGEYDTPSLKEVRSGHFVSCLLYDEPLAEIEVKQANAKTITTDN